MRPRVAALALLSAWGVAAGAGPLRKDCHGRPGCQAECTAGIGASCRALAKMIPEREAELTRRGCALGDCESCQARYSGERYPSWDADVRRVVAAATAAARRQCERGDALLCRSRAALLGWAVAAEEAPREPMHAAIAHARDRFRRGCDAGDAVACHELASALSGAVDMKRAHGDRGRGAGGVAAVREGVRRRLRPRRLGARVACRRALPSDVRRRGEPAALGAHERRLRQG